MTTRAATRLRSTLSRAALPAVALIVMAFFGAYAVLGPNGGLAYGDYKQKIAVRERELASIEARRAVFQNRVALLDPAHANPDMVDELVRAKLNVMHPDEVAIPLR